MGKYVERGPEYVVGGMQSEVRPVEERGARREGRGPRAKEQGAIPGEKGPRGAGSVAVVQDAGMSVCRVKVGKWAVVRGASEGLRGWLDRNLTFKNPRYEQQVKFGRDVGDAEPNFRMCRYRDGDAIIPRGFLSKLIDWCHGRRVKFEYEDGCVKRPVKKPIQLKVGLSGEQERVLSLIGGRRYGILVGAPGCGRRLVAMARAAGRQEKVLILVKTKKQLYAWDAFLGRHVEADVGLLGDGKKQVEADVLVAIDRSFYLNLGDGNVVGRGVVIVDRIDEVNPKVFMTGLGSVDCGVSLGLACSKRRKDRLTGLMEACAGPVIGEMEGGGAVTKGLRVMIMESGIRIGDDLDWAAVKKKMMADDGRNFRISQELGALTSNGRRALVVSHEKKHLDNIGLCLDYHREARAC